nr:uncharacterized protein LOC127347839 [Lolium perenne]
MAMATTGMLDWCPCLLGAGVKEGGSSVVAIVPWSKMMTCLRLVVVLSAAGIFSKAPAAVDAYGPFLHRCCSPPAPWIPLGLVQPRIRTRPSGTSAAHWLRRLRSPASREVPVAASYFPSRLQRGGTRSWLPEVQYPKSLHSLGIPVRHRPRYSQMNRGSCLRSLITMVCINLIQRMMLLV